MWVADVCNGAFSAIRLNLTGSNQPVSQVPVGVTSSRAILGHGLGGLSFTPTTPINDCWLNDTDRTCSYVRTLLIGLNANPFSIIRSLWARVLETSFLSYEWMIRNIVSFG
jgi:hypothetical protein